MSETDENHPPEEHENKLLYYLKNKAEWLWKTIDDLWKVWRWLALSLAASSAYEIKKYNNLKYIAWAMFAIAVLSTATWLMPIYYSSFTKKGHASGLIATLLLAFVMILIPFYMALNFLTAIGLLASGMF